jgi:hypothetical protein
LYSRRENVEHVLPVAHTIEERRERADVHPVRADGDQVADDPGELGHDHADHFDTLRNLDFQQLLRRDHVPEFHAHRRHVVHPVGVRDHLLVVRHVLAVFLETPVQVADVRDDINHDFPVHDQLQPEHTVRGGMLRSHTDDHLVRPERTPQSRDREGPFGGSGQRGLFHQYGTFIPL